MDSCNNKKYKEAFQKDDKSLVILLRNMAKFDKDFCDLMVEGFDFTLSLTVKGEEGKMSYCKVRADSFDRPEGTPKKYQGRGIVKSDS